MLLLGMLGKSFSRRQVEIFLKFSQKTGFGLSRKLSPEETICMKDQNPFSGKNKKNILNVTCQYFFFSMRSVKYI